MARAWNAPSARILRRASGAPEDAGLGLILQEVALGIGPGISGSGYLQTVDERTGAPGCAGVFLPQGQGPEARPGTPDLRRLTREARREAGEDLSSLEEISPATLATLRDAAERAEPGLGAAYRLGFAVPDGTIAILEARLV
jgi:pyruvate,orthophosphate dikinase